MREQPVAGTELLSHHNLIRRERFLTAFDRIVPGHVQVDVDVPYYPTGKRGRLPVGLDPMVRVDCLGTGIDCRIWRRRRCCSTPRRCGAFLAPVSIARWRRTIGRSASSATHSKSVTGLEQCLRISTPFTGANSRAPRTLAPGPSVPQIRRRTSVSDAIGGAPDLRKGITGVMCAAVDAAFDLPNQISVATGILMPNVATNGEWY
jgi:hypothetical protein